MKQKTNTDTFRLSSQTSFHTDTRLKSRPVHTTGRCCVGGSLRPRVRTGARGSQPAEPWVPSVHVSAAPVLGRGQTGSPTVRRSHNRNGASSRGGGCSLLCKRMADGEDGEEPCRDRHPGGAGGVQNRGNHTAVKTGSDAVAPAGRKTNAPEGRTPSSLPDGRPILPGTREPGHAGQRPLFPCWAFGEFGDVRSHKGNQAWA